MALLEQPVYSEIRQSNWWESFGIKVPPSRTIVIAHFSQTPGNITQVDLTYKNNGAWLTCEEIVNGENIDFIIGPDGYPSATGIRWDTLHYYTYPVAVTLSGTEAEEIDHQELLSPKFINLGPSVEAKVLSLKTPLPPKTSGLFKYIDIFQRRVLDERDPHINEYYICLRLPISNGNFSPQDDLYQPFIDLKRLISGKNESRRRGGTQITLYGIPFDRA